MNTKLLLVTFFMAVMGINVQAASESNDDLLNLPGDNLDLFATLNLFQESKTIEEFEASLNDEKTGINNLDLNLDGDVDFIKVVTQQDGGDFAFVLQVDVLEEETQDVAVIVVTKDAEEKVSIQMVGDEALYGKDYVIEPKLEKPAVTANPAYSGPDTIVVKSEPATVVVVESQPIVHYVYSPMYSPYYSPYYYGYYPPYYHPYPVVSINIYFGRNRHHHNHYHGGHRGGNTVIINNNKTYNNYNRTRKTSTTVNKNKSAGSYKANNANKPAGVEQNGKKVNTNTSKSKQKASSTKSNVKTTKPATSVKTNKVNTTKPVNNSMGKAKGKRSKR
ncbi:hypothetical protein [Carboxylicivirga sp. M1479]|uniref:hypothetical protein n=1 Tax=Carboxylicivirga sp. M1479 TaxID=2594476 RepID=UPI0011788E20|nr:hypothetical protein [Carboxylicivirga sp. M1479]TRX71001.1 hypothetical protein FNN09_08280 [Carboxylicivirga sp. M1479]